MTAQLAITFEFEVGLGLYDKAPISQGFVGFNNPDLAKIDWDNKAKNVTYTVKIEIDPDGTWKYSDSGADVDKSGRWAAR